MIKTKYKDGSYCRAYDSGSKYWFNDKGQWHRTAGPATEYANGTKVWYLHGRLVYVENTQ
jgi:hypothetical protein